MSLTQASKYKNIPSCWEGVWRGRKQVIMFQSKLELIHWLRLVLLLKGGEISELRTQEPFLLLTGTVQESPIIYRADFCYFDCRFQNWHVDECKGVKTRAYILKRKLFRAQYPDFKFTEIFS